MAFNKGTNKCGCENGVRESNRDRKDQATTRGGHHGPVLPPKCGAIERSHNSWPTSKETERFNKTQLIASSSYYMK